MSHMTEACHVFDEEYARISKELDRARELREADTSKMSLAQKVEHQRAIKETMNRARN